MKRSGSRAKPLYVGVTGHRPNRMPEKEWPRIKMDLAHVMGEIEATNPSRKLVLLSGLAEGADRLAAFVALGRGWALGAILAFHRARFAEDFPDPASVGEFRALLAAAGEVTEPGRSAHVGKPAEDGHDAVAKRLIDRSDVLIAIWDGGGSRGRGGTVEIIESAREKGTPVRWIHACRVQPPQMLSPSRRSVRTSD